MTEAAAAHLEQTFLRLDHAIGAFSLAELAAALVVVALAFTRPGLGAGAFAGIERRLSGLANHPTRQILAVGLLALLARAALLPWLGAPEPLIHDEHSLLLQARTFMEGRLANPPHPLWEHFETFHVNQLPAYSSAFFPGRSAPLVVGLFLFDHAWAGIWLSVVLMCMAAVWMLQAWVALPFALLGGVLVVVRFGLFSYWINSYWGGAFTALGAMLVLGALPRILRQPRWQHGVLMGLGAAILMISRPYEGALLCLPVAAVLLARLLRPATTSVRALLLRVALPSGAFIAAGGALLLAFNAAATGELLKTAYDVNRQTYATAPAFLVSPPLSSQERGPPYFRTFYEIESAGYDRRHSGPQVVRGVLAKLFHTWNFTVGALFAAALLAGLWSARGEAFLLVTLAFFAAGYLLETWHFPHYIAPIYPVLLILLLRGFEWLRKWQWRGRPAGLFLTRAMPTAAILLLALPTSTVVFGIPALQNNLHSNSCCAIKDSADFNLRAALERQLLARPGRDLVLVKDGPNNPVHYELVYNAPDIDASEVVWARRLGAEKDQALLAHFADRQLWEFEWLPPPGPGHSFRPVLRDSMSHQP